MTADPTYNAKIHINQGGDTGSIESGGVLTVESGGTLEVASGGILSLNGTTIGATAAELNTAADLSANGALVRVKKIAISSTPTGSEQDTGWDLPAKSVVHEVFVDVTTAEATGATKTLDVGLLASESGGDADGFVDGVSVSSTGLKLVSLVAGGVTRGLLLRETVTDNGTATHSSPNVYASTANTAKSVSYTAGSNDFAEFRGAIYIVYTELG